MESMVLEDGTVANEGDTVWNFYDMVPALIVSIGSDGWADTECYDEEKDLTTHPMLDGSRMCSLAFARKKGWTK